MNEHVILSASCVDLSFLFKFVSDPFDTARNQVVSFYSDSYLFCYRTLQASLMSVAGGL